LDGKKLWIVEREVKGLTDFGMGGLHAGGVGGRQNKALPTFVQRGILQDRCCQNRTGGTVPHAADPGFRGLRSPGNLGYVLRPLQSHSECGNRRE